MDINSKRIKFGSKAIILVAVLLSLGFNTINVGNSVQNKGTSAPETSDVELVRLYDF